MSRRRAPPSPGLFRGAVFLGSFLVFVVQPLVARRLLPYLGGSAQVWTSCVLFFQVSLLLGYAYAHLITTRLETRARLWVHLTLLIVGAALLVGGRLATLPAAVPARPVLWLLGWLGRWVALPFAALAAGAPLIQAWFADSGSRGRHDPYRLYSASNLGSLAALLAYPLLIEPLLGLERQLMALALGYGCYALWLAAAVLGSDPDAEGDGIEVVPSMPAPPIPGEERRWLLLAAVPSSLMLGVTAHMTTELPSIPLLWVVPLGLYLGSFALAFSPRQPFPPGLFASLHPLLTAVLAMVVFVPMRVAGFSLHLAALFVTACLLHLELAASRPGPERLTAFFLWVAAGGALGGLFNTLAAPLLFPFVAEYPLALVAACLLQPSRPQPRVGAGRAAVGPALLGLATWAVLTCLPMVGDERDVAARLGVLLVAAAIALTWRRRPARFAAGVAVVLAGGFLAFRLPGTVDMARSVYGAYRVSREPGTRRFGLYHGTTLQGAQDHDADGGAPISYFHPRSPAADLLARRAPAAARVGVVGLGVGALAHYLQPGQQLRFYEIDGLVEALARDPRHFSYLQRSPGAVEVVIDDGRLALAREPDSSFDLLFLDAFSSDAVPVHLVTLEACRMYLKKLAPGGALVFNTSNRHIRLEALVAALGAELGLESREAAPPDLGAAEVARGWTRARWALLTPSPEAAEAWAPASSGWSRLRADPDTAAWRDDFAALLPVLRW